MTYINPQNAWISASTAETEARVREFLKSVYLWMFGGLLLTSLASLLVVSSPALQQLIFGNRLVMFGLIGAELVSVIALSAGINRFSPATAASLFLGYSFLNGLTLSVILWIYTQQSVVQAFVIAAGMFGAMSVYGAVTKRDLTGMGTFLRMGVFGLLIAMIANFFFRSSAFSLAISLVGVVIFTGLTAWDTQRLRTMAVSMSPGQESKAAVYGALKLYLDFVNLFLFLLRLFGNRRR